MCNELYKGDSFFSLSSKGFIVLYSLVDTKSDRSCCVKIEKKKSLKEKFKPCMLFHLGTPGKFLLKWVGLLNCGFWWVTKIPIPTSERCWGTGFTLSDRRFIWSMQTHTKSQLGSPSTTHFLSQWHLSLLRVHTAKPASPPWSPLPLCILLKTVHRWRYVVHQNVNQNPSYYSIWPAQYKPVCRLQSSVTSIP